MVLFGPVPGHPCRSVALANRIFARLLPSCGDKECQEISNGDYPVPGV